MSMYRLQDGINIQPDNPTNEQRHEMARTALAQKGRLDDFEYIRTLTSPAREITGIARPGELKGYKVGIIGGGLAGLTAAFELRKLGLDITVFDALEDRIGGRVYTHYFDRDKRYYGELGPMRIPVTHETSWHYINLFKLDTSPFIQVNENAFIYLRDVRVRNDPRGLNVQRYIYPKYDLTPAERATPWQQLEFYGFEGPILASVPEVRSEIIRVLQRYYPQILFWDSINIRKILEGERLSLDAISLLSNFLPLAGQNLYNSYIDYVQELYTVDLSFLYKINGGFVNLPLAFYKAILNKNPERGYEGIPVNCLGSVMWRGAHWVTGIYLDGQDTKLVLRFKSINTDKPEYEKFDYIICAIPFSTLRTVDVQPLFSHVKMQAIREVNYIPAQKTALYCNKRFWEEGGPHEQIIGGVSYTDLPISQLWYPSDHVGYCTKELNLMKNCHPSYTLFYKDHSSKALSEEPGVLLVYNFNLETTRLTNMEERERIEEIKREVEMVQGLPKGYMDQVLIDYKVMNWNNDPWFRGALCMYTTEQKRLFSYASAYPEYDNRVFFAGEHISAKHRWIQGALKSGMDAANQLAFECMRRSRTK